MQRFDDCMPGDRAPEQQALPPADAGRRAGRPELCVGAIAVEGGRLLLIRRGRGPAQGRWSVPGGRLERGETLAEAVVREVAEETGLEAVCD